jgi:hypothetical protein
LTLYNFLKFHVADQGLTDRSQFDNENLIATLNEERIKDLIHNEYMFYFNRKKEMNIYANKVFNTEPFINDLKSKIKVSSD